MGWETLAIAGASALNASQTTKQGKSAAKGIVEQGRIDAENKAHDTVRAAGKLQFSFLNSGITLEGGPMDLIMSAFKAGNQDISQIVNNANASSKNTVNAARTKALEGLMKTAGAAAGGSAAGAGDFQFGGSGFDGLGQEIGSAFDPSPTGPFQTPFDSSSGFWGQ